ncbi:4-hydroxy-tetrahydrodipicolinate synthase [Clostridium homopropionicum DSM 5847]|uniref:4-hydroxy-tetrahydrodipicolinate synthase n=1 Tax=Clostridium homopropionicum DSM 5847 TaxID=1121318 RepID=A0A0L6Z650_9CLOT|nr:dihydrodipicolinate synthase family protein [Clostridium homopropionicum]KOA18449.1 4-hydroxy-tetrahydrodipicolinate synthase [Clostridium homopropionicum DSM 5847]SFF66601.1 4-hydroxy-tetrahydrodipicolinate synthase [Clostridium homopropionicum]
MNKKYFGVIPPIITPVDKRENVDEEGFCKLLDHCIEGGLHGIFVAGSNGETMALTQKERDKAIKVAIDHVNGRVPVMSGVMDSSTRRVIDNIKSLEQMGGTCAVITSIFYARHTSQDETIRHFEQIAKETNIDLIIYNIPMFTGLKLNAETVMKIAEIDNVVGYKDSSGSFPEFMRCLTHFKDTDFACLQGSTPYAMPSMLIGADGFVPSIAPLFPELFVKAYEAGANKDIDLAMKYDILLRETSKVLGMTKNATSANKFALSQLGFTDKRVIAPQDSIQPEEEQKIIRKIAEINEQYAEMKASLK